MGQYDIVVAGGVESMSNAPYLLAGGRQGLRYGEVPLMDAPDRDALVCGFDGISMGAVIERNQAGAAVACRGGGGGGQGDALIRSFRA